MSVALKDKKEAGELKISPKKELKITIILKDNPKKKTRDMGCKKTEITAWSRLTL